MLGKWFQIDRHSIVCRLKENGGVQPNEPTEAVGRGHSILAELFRGDEIIWSQIHISVAESIL